MRKRFVSILIVLAAAAGVSACGGGDADDQVGLAYVGPAAQPFCPIDPAAFVGPLPQQCFDQLPKDRP
jgi:hypothetical protein